MIIQYTIEGVHSWKRDKVTARGGHARTYRPKGDAGAKGAHAKACLIELCKVGEADQFAGPFGLLRMPYGATDQWAVHVVYSPANERAHDTDRVLTLVLDALTGVVWHDDSDKFVRRSSCEVVRGDKLYPPGTTTVCIERVAGPYVAQKKTRARRATADDVSDCEFPSLNVRAIEAVKSRAKRST